MLTNESPKYLFGNQTCQVSDRLSDMNIGEPRPRSDSSGSNMSNASSSSASSRPPYHSIHSLQNVPGYRGPIIGNDDCHPSTAPIRPNELNQFMDLYRNEQNPNEIPNIPSYVGNRIVNYDVNSGYNSSGNASASSSQTVLRPIEVQHIQTSRETSAAGQQPNYFEIRFTPSHGAASSHVTHVTQSQPVTPNQGWRQHPVFSNNPYQNVSYPNNQHQAFPSDLRSLPISQHPYRENSSSTASSPYRSPDDEHVSFGAYGQQHEPQHSSQATIFLQNPLGNSQTFSRYERPMHSPGQYTTNIPPSNEHGLSPNVFRSTAVSSSQPSPKGITGPVLVEIKTPQRGGGVQSHIQYFNKIAGTPNSNHSGASPQTMQNVIFGRVTPPNENMSQDSHHAYVSRHYTPERPTVINIQGIGTSRDDGGFLKFPPMPNECRVPGHPPGMIQKSPSVDSNSVFSSDLEYRRVPMQPFMSPASSHSSLSSESSAARERPRSGSLQDDPEYLKGISSDLLFYSYC